MRMRCALPVVPPAWITVTPGARAFRRVATFGVAACGMSPGDSVATEFPVSRFRCVSPVAVVTTASRVTAAAVIEKSAVAVWPAATATDWVRASKPIRAARTW